MKHIHSILLLFIALNIAAQDNATIIYKPGINFSYALSFINDENALATYEGPYPTAYESITVDQKFIQSFRVNSTHHVFINEWLIDIGVGLGYNSSQHKTTLQHFDSLSDYSITYQQNLLSAHTNVAVKRMFNVKEEMYFSIGIGTEISTVLTHFNNNFGRSFNADPDAQFNFRLTDITTDNVLQVNPFLGFDFFFPLDQYYFKAGIAYHLYPVVKYYNNIFFEDQNGTLSRVKYASNNSAGYLKVGVSFLFGGIQKK